MRFRAPAIAIGIVATIVAAGACSAFSSADDPPVPALEGGADGPVVMPGDGPALDGDAGGAPIAPFPLATGLVDLAGIAANEETVFFVEQDPGRVRAVSIENGGTLIDIALGQGSPSAIVAFDDVLVWSDFDKKLLTSRGLPTGTPTPVNVNGGLSPVAIARGGDDRVVVVALDRADQNKGKVQQYTKGLAYVGTTSMIFQNPFDVAVNANDVYWTESSAQTIWKGSLDSTDSTSTFTPEDDCQSIAADDQGVYWTRPATGVVRAVVPGKAPGAYDLAPGQAAPFSLATDGDNVYWLTNDGTLRRSNRDVGQPPRTLATGFASAFADTHIQAIALTARYVVWLTSDGRILRLAK